jgi:hypothetical protein
LTDAMAVLELVGAGNSAVSSDQQFRDAILND